MCDGHLVLRSWYCCRMKNEDFKVKTVRSSLASTHDRYKGQCFIMRACSRKVIFVEKSLDLFSFKYKIFNDLTHFMCQAYGYCTGWNCWKCMHSLHEVIVGARVLSWSSKSRPYLWIIMLFCENVFTAKSVVLY